ncbi:hypothetical protein ABW19_dt0210104 [Dactylella cylindrospora]|nr:hypothetical protein ABW19_dt0210104 [Dactylella cylindrospora]
MSDIPYLATQSALTDSHIRHHPTLEESLAPSTSADTKEVLSQDEPYSDEEEEVTHPLEDEDDDDDVASITSSILYAPRHRTLRPLPPLPDLRFEQSYLASIKRAVEEKKYWVGS